ncbi:MAG: PAS domain S-box protein [Thermoguttaceae bacterium]
MDDHRKSDGQLVTELASLRRRVAVLENAEAERTRMERSLRESLERYRLLSDTIPYPVWRCDAEGTRVEANQRWYDYTGQTPDDARGFGWMKAIHPDDVEQVSARIAELQAGGKFYEAEYRLRRATDGAYRWHLARAMPTKDAQGKVTGWFGSAADIEDRKQAEDELRKSRALLQATIDSLPFDFFALDQNQRYVLQNAASKARWGDAIGKRPDNTTQDGDVLRVWVEANRRAFAGERVAYEVVMKPQGETRYYESAVAPILDHGQIQGVLGMNIDITARKEAEQALQRARDLLEQKVVERTAELARANEQLQNEVHVRRRAEDSLRQERDEFRAIYDSMSEGMLIVDFETKHIVRVNAALCRMLGYSEEELLAISVKDIHPPEDTPSLLQRLEEWAAGSRREEVDIPMIRKDGAVFPADIMGNRLVCQGRRCIAGFFRDITERKRAQERLQREHAILRHLLESSDHERRQIAYEIHDGLAQELAGAIMQFQTFECLKEHDASQAAQAFDAGMGMLRQGHFEVRRLIAGVRPPVLDEQGIVAAIAHLVHEQRLRNGPNIEFRSRVDFDRLAPPLESAIYRIVQEGLANACEHSESKIIRVRLVQRGAVVRIEVRDWGTGFDPKQMQTKRGRYGLMGLRQRARLLGGRCSIQSAPGKGARVIVELPVIVGRPE